jgi:hypothetical protein
MVTAGTEKKTPWTPGPWRVSRWGAVGDFVINAPAHLRLADLTFLHRDGFLE